MSFKKFNYSYSILLCLVIIISCQDKNKKGGPSSCLMDNGEYYQLEENWNQGVLWYQIFPERFRNGTHSNDPSSKRVTSITEWEVSSWSADWNKMTSWEQNHSNEFYNVVFDRRYGGDLQGIIDKLDYLQSLGIGAIYLNPVFDAISLHKYDASSFHHIDRYFGPDPDGDETIMDIEDPSDPSTWIWTSADKLFIELIKKAHNHNIKIIIDGVFNHTGRDFWAFKDIMENQEASPFSYWYHIKEFDNPATSDTNEFDYQGWWGVYDLPEFQDENGNLPYGVKEYIRDISQRWMDPNGDGNPCDGIDGWRLDVTEEVGISFWKEWHQYIKDINPYIFTSAEIWSENAVNYLNPHLFTSVMNYPFAYVTKNFFIDKNISTVEAQKQYEHILSLYESDHRTLSLMNLMDSHDTPRLASMIVNPGLDYDRQAHPKDGFNIRKPNQEERLIQRLIGLFQYTYRGSPMIYYGTETGMWGADDPHDRKPMLWEDIVYEDEVNHPHGEDRPRDKNQFDNELFKFYKEIANFRNQHIQHIKKGEVIFLQNMPEHTIGFIRYIQEKNIIDDGDNINEKGKSAYAIILNRSSKEPIEINLEQTMPPQFQGVQIEHLYQTTTGKKENITTYPLLALQPLSGHILELSFSKN